MSKKKGEITLRQHYDMRFKLLDRFLAERDRRITSEAMLRAEALRIKEIGDQQALVLSRETQTYKDQQHNGLLQVLTSERAMLATKDDVRAEADKVRTEFSGALNGFREALKPLAEYVSGQNAKSKGFNWLWGVFLGAAAFTLSAVSLYAALHR